MEEIQNNSNVPVLPEVAGPTPPVSGAAIIQPIQSAPKKRPAARLVGFLALILVLVVALAAGAVWGYTYFFPSPEAVVAKMVQRMSDAKTAQFQGNLDVEVSYQGGGMYSADNTENQKMNFSLNFDGASDVTDPKNQKGSVNIKLSNEQYLKGDISLNLITLGKIIYAKITSNSSMVDSVYSSDDNPFLNQWLEIDYAKIVDKLTQQYPSLADYYKQNAKTLQVTPAQTAQIRNLAKKAKILVISKQLSDEAVGGVACRHYQGWIDKDALRNYMRGVGAILQDQVSQAQIGQVIDVIGKADFSNIEIWVAKNDFSARRIKLTMNYKDSYYGLISFSVKVDTDFNYTNINKPVTISAPQNSKPLLDIIEKSMGSAMSSAQDARRQSDMRQLMSAQEMYYGDTNRYYTCGTTGGDCKGKLNNFPSEIGTYLKTPQDPSISGTVCGTDYIYCGLDNTKDSSKFCYYAKMADGGFYISSNEGNSKRSTAPANFSECASSDSVPEPTISATTSSAQSRDARRLADMRQLVSAEEMYYGDNDRYYTCGTAAGDCTGKANNYPATISKYMPTMPKDPLNNGSVCGTSYVYCGLDNSKNSDKFCFYAKMESGGFYTSSDRGNFKRTTAPKTIAECGQTN